MDLQPNNQSSPPNQAPMLSKKWYQHKGMVAIGILVVLTALVSYAAIKKGSLDLISGGGSEQYSPDTISSGEPVTIKFIVSTWGSGGTIQNRYSDLALHYRLVGENDYKMVSSQPDTLPDNYVKAMTAEKQWAAYKFIIPAYPQNSTGQIEYYIDFKFDKQLNHVNGIKKIQIISDNSQIKVISPNGGEKWQIGSTYQVTWKLGNSTNADKVEISIVGENPNKCHTTTQGGSVLGGKGVICEQPPRFTIQPKVDNAGVYNWTIDRDNGLNAPIPAGKYKLEVTIMKPDTKPFEFAKIIGQDDSDDYFEILPKTANQASFTIGADVHTTGTVIENVTKLAPVDGPAYLTVQTTDGKQIRVTYSPGEAECKNADNSAIGFSIKSNDKVDVFAKAIGENELFTCPSLNYYIKLLN